MSVLINFKICDNAKECGGIRACSSGALFWDDKKKTIKINNTKCTSCGLCRGACEVGAIEVAMNDEEYKRIQKEFDDDPRKISDLYLDRYGAQPIIPAFLINERRFEQEVKELKRLFVAELFKSDTIECMIKSIPIKELIHGKDIQYKKVEVKNNELLSKYHIQELPALLFFKDGKVLGKIEGYYNLDSKEEIIKKIKNIIDC